MVKDEPACERMVLVVEDDADIRESLAEVLREHGFKVSTAEHGREALNYLMTAKVQPCVALVDLMLPVMTGWEFVAEVRRTPSLAGLPVIVTSAVADRAPPEVDRVMAKPLQLDMLIDAISAICEQPRAVDSSAVIRELARRNVELAELRRFRDEMVDLIVHDLRNPLSVVTADLQYAIGELKDIPADVREALLDARSAANRTCRLLENLLALTKMETGVFTLKRSLVSLDRLLRPLVEERRLLAREKRVGISLDVQPGLILDADANLMARLFENLLDNACRYTSSDGQVVVSASRDERLVTLSVGNTGEPIPEASRSVIFDKYGQLGARTEGHGLGLYFCRLVAELHGGSILVEERAETPVTFVLKLPV
jgi:signal transduction histidine kinase